LLDLSRPAFFPFSNLPQDVREFKIPVSVSAPGICFPCSGAQNRFVPSLLDNFFYCFFRSPRWNGGFFPLGLFCWPPVLGVHPRRGPLSFQWCFRIFVQMRSGICLSSLHPCLGPFSPPPQPHPDGARFPICKGLSPLEEFSMAFHLFFVSVISDTLPAPDTERPDRFGGRAVMQLLLPLVPLPPPGIYDATA